MHEDENMQRYSRQIVLKEIGYEGQNKLLNSRVLIIGAGGLGSPALYYLTACGIGTIGIADYDTVGLSNLQRQILHFTSDIGKKKVVSAEEKLTAINPKVNIIKYPYRLNIDNIEDTIRDFDIVIDAVDNFPARFLISDCCFFMKKPLIEGAAVGFNGILMTILPGRSPCYRCLYPQPPEDGAIPACEDTGILGMITGTIGSLQALEAVKALLGIGETLSGRLLTFDGLTSSFREITWHKKKHCPLCGESPVIKKLQQYEQKCRPKS